MNEYTRGTFEYLSWLEEVISMLREKGKSWETFSVKIGEAIHDIQWGVVVNFREHLRATV